MARINMFTYGSLMFPAVWQGLVRGTYNQVAAEITGFHRSCIKGDVYPVITPSQSLLPLTGVAYINLSPRDLRQLDRFEGNYYQRQLVTANTDNGPLDCWVYVLKRRYQILASTRPWCPDTFAQRHLQQFRRCYRPQ